MEVDTIKDSEKKNPTQPKVPLGSASKAKLATNQLSLTKLATNLLSLTQLSTTWTWCLSCSDSWESLACPPSCRILWGTALCRSSLTTGRERGRRATMSRSGSRCSTATDPEAGEKVEFQLFILKEMKISVRKLLTARLRCCMEGWTGGGLSWSAASGGWAWGRNTGAWWPPTPAGGGISSTICFPRMMSSLGRSV